MKFILLFLFIPFFVFASPSKVFFEQNKLKLISKNYSDEIEVKKCNKEILEKFVKKQSRPLYKKRKLQDDFVYLKTQGKILCSKK